MRIYSKRIGIIIGIVFTIFVVVIAITFNSTFDEIMLNQTAETASNYPKNGNGLTYGSANEAPSVEMLPDLIYVGSVDGTAGYLQKPDYLSECGCIVPMYDVEGKIVIGSFRISAMNQFTTKAPNYSKNESGQTYGSASDAISPETEPDLIRAVGVDGTEGFVFKRDLEGELPKTPEEALAIQKNRPPGGRDIPLYDVDGETVIGVFHIGVGK